MQESQANNMHLTMCYDDELKKPQPFKATEIDTHGAYDLEFFTVDGELYLAVANSKTTTQPWPTFVFVESAIYRWDNGDFVLQTQTDVTYGASGWEHFVIGDDHYLALAIHETDQSPDRYITDSYVLKWDNNTRTLQEHQAIETNGAYDWKHFEIDGSHYLVVANNHAKSVVYIWKPTLNKFVEYQHIDSTNAVHWEHFTIGNEDFFAVSNKRVDALSTVYRWENQTMVEYQRLNKTNIAHIEHAVIDGVHYLAAAKGGSYVDDQESAFYRFENNAFVDFLRVNTSDAYSWEHFEVNGIHYFAVANSVKVPGGGQTYSVVYRWENGTLVEQKRYETNYATDVKYFEVGGVNHVIFAEIGNVDTKSRVFRDPQLPPLCEGISS
eukprot:m.347643 g.347643  ORF g.347643 m.347643 type:complete len:382 (-) comp33713_c0_seq1:31-1176(-)